MSTIHIVEMRFQLFFDFFVVCLAIRGCTNFEGDHHCELIKNCELDVGLPSNKQTIHINKSIINWFIFRYDSYQLNFNV
jgi:hypothetical protein